uniref:Uncharacterized protein n=1 Tax=Romanomermis culicivorax TaxID=13658 RepID=A0A915JSK2_ROMCU
MKVPVLTFILGLSVLQYQCDEQPCTTSDASMLNVTKSLLVVFSEIPTTENIRRGEVVFDREQAKFNVSKDYGFLVNEPQSRLRDLIEGWISKGFLGGLVTQMIWRTFNRTLTEKARDNIHIEMFSPSSGIWKSYWLKSARTADDRLSAAYAFLLLKHKDSQVNITNPEGSDLRHFVSYKNRINFNEELANDIARFSIEYDRCHQ